jgi:4-hydroxybenzoate polyprenyltransferase
MTHPVSKLFRWRPVTAWGIIGITIAVACAFHSGLTIDWVNLFYVTGVILLVQGIIAHGVNDLADVEVDRIAPIEETGRSKVLVTGEMTRDKMLALLGSTGLTAFLLVIYLAMRAGPYVFVFAAFAAFAVFGYSCKPLRLGWHPFSELTVVVPTITAMILGVEYVLIGTVTAPALLLGSSYGFFNASWFMFSRAQDYEADKEVGKRTTIVSYGLSYTQDFAVLYLVMSGIMMVYALAFVHWYMAIMIAFSWIFPAACFFNTIRHPGGYPLSFTPHNLACVRLKGILFAVIYGVCISLAIVWGMMI